jgi:outer membrane protein assembly factor BamC
VLPEVERMRIERAGTQRWLVVQGEPPEKLWPLVKDFWQEGGFLIKMENPEAGVMETDWAETARRFPRARCASSSARSSSRCTRPPSATSTARGSTARPTAAPRSTSATAACRSSTPRASRPRARRDRPRGSRARRTRSSKPEFLRRLMVRLGARDEKAKELAAVAAPQQRADIVKANDGTERLQVHEPFDRAWRRVGLALDRVGFTVEDRDRQKGLYFVRYADPEAEMGEKDKGIFGHIAGWFSSDSKVKAAQYRVQVTQESGGATAGSQVYVLNKDGKAESSKTSQRILALLHEQLK